MGNNQYLTCYRQPSLIKFELFEGQKNPTILKQVQCQNKIVVHATVGLVGGCGSSVVSGEIS